MIEITAAMVRQYNAKNLALSDPCIICHGDVIKCGHLDATPAVIERIKKMGKSGRDAILAKEKK